MFLHYWLLVVGMREQWWDLADRHSSIIGIFLFPKHPTYLWLNRSLGLSFRLRGRCSRVLANGHKTWPEFHIHGCKFGPPSPLATGHKEPLLWGRYTEQWPWKTAWESPLESRKTDPAQWGNQSHWDKQPHEGAKTFWDVGSSKTS